jgi:putative endonuclease
MSCVWSVYLLRCSDNSLYCGITTDIKRRVATHNDGKGARYTRARRPVSVVYTEPAKGRSEALKREYAIKKLSKIKKENMVKHITGHPDNRVCPKCGSHKIEMFDSDNDICKKCGEWFTGS